MFCVVVSKNHVQQAMMGKLQIIQQSKFGVGPCYRG